MSNNCTVHISYTCAATIAYNRKKSHSRNCTPHIQLPSDSTELLPSQTTVKHVNNTPIQLPFHQSHIFKVKQLSSSHLIELCGSHLKQLYTSHIIQLCSNPVIQQKNTLLKQQYTSHIIQLCGYHLIQQKIPFSSNSTPHISYN